MKLGCFWVFLGYFWVIPGFGFRSIAIVFNNLLGSSIKKQYFSSFFSPPGVDLSSQAHSGRRGCPI
jgi:hypothetical protein